MFLKPEAASDTRREPEFPAAAAGTLSHVRFSADLAALLVVPIPPDVGIIAAISQLPRTSTRISATVVDVARILGGKTLIPFFSGSEESVEIFSASYNGTGWRRIARMLEGSGLSRAALEDLLASFIEDALIATFSHLVAGGSNILMLGAEEEFILKTAIAERLPRIFGEDALLLAENLVQDLKNRIGDSGALAIDDGAVVLCSGKLSIVDVGDQPVKFGEVLVLRRVC